VKVLHLSRKVDMCMVGRAGDGLAGGACTMEGPLGMGVLL
jgi:hypothetical protein